MLSIIQPILRGMIEAIAPKLIDDTLGGFSLSMRWTGESVKFYVNWTFRKGTTAASKVPTDWMEQGLNMNYRIAYLVKVYNIPPYLVINSYQTGIHLIPSAGGRTWDVKGVKDVKIFGLEDKRQITCVVSSNASGELLPPHLIFTNTNNWCLLKYTAAKTRCLEEGILPF